MLKIFNIFRKPQIRAKLFKGGAKAKVTTINATAEQVMILLYMATKQLAGQLKKDHRQLLNELVDLDKRIVRSRKQEEREVKYGRKK